MVFDLDPSMADADDHADAPVGKEAEAIIHAIQASLASLPVLDHRTAEEILGYDEHGLPT